jgi:hypothetical protein
MLKLLIEWNYQESYWNIIICKLKKRDNWNNIWIRQKENVKYSFSLHNFLGIYQSNILINRLSYIRLTLPRSMIAIRCKLTKNEQTHHTLIRCYYRIQKRYKFTFVYKTKCWCTIPTGDLWPCKSTGISRSLKNEIRIFKTIWNLRVHK